MRFVHKNGVSIKHPAAVRTGLEPATSGVTGQHSNQTELPDQGRKLKSDVVVPTVW